MSNSGTEQHWMNSSLTDLPFKDILKKFDDEMDLDPPEGMPFILKQVKFLEDNFSIEPINLDDKSIFRLRDEKQGEYYQLTFHEDRIVTRTVYDFGGKVVGEERYYRLYPFSIEIGEWILWEDGKMKSIKKDPEFSFLDALEKVKSSSDFEDFDLFDAERSRVEVGDLEVECWMLEFHIYPNMKRYFFGVNNGKLITETEGVVDY